MARRFAITVTVVATVLGSAVVSVPPATADPCPVPAGGHWTGLAVSVPFAPATFVIDSNVSFGPGGAVTGTASFNGSMPYALSGTVTCGSITFGTVAPSTTFTGTFDPDGRSASGLYSTGLGDSGSWTSAADPYALTATSTVQPTTIAPGGASSWVIDVENTGAAASTFTEATFDLSGAGTFGPLGQSSVSQGSGCTPDIEDTTVVHCDLGTLLPGQSEHANVTVVSTGGAGTSILAEGFASSTVGGGGDGTAPPVTISVVAKDDLPAGEASGVAKPGVTFSTPGTKATEENPILVKFKLPKKIASGNVARRSRHHHGGHRNPVRLMAFTRPRANTVTGPVVPMSISRSSAEAGTFCGGSPCSGDVIHLTAFSGYTDRKRPAKLTIVWDVSVAGRGRSSIIYKRKDAAGSPTRTLPACIKAGSLGYANLPCVSKKKVLGSGDVQFVILMLSGDPKFARR
jgi:hypothetical protein